MSASISAPDVSTAWVEAVQHLIARPDRHRSNLVVSIENPTSEIDGVRRELERFGASEQDRGKPIPAIHSVAGTIFPKGLYKPNAEAPDQHLYQLERKIRHVVRKHDKNRRGTYFERFVAYPVGQGEPVNQLDRVVRKLRRSAELGHRNGNMFELAAYHPRHDTNPEGFPCLSHLSVTLHRGRLDGAAIYRNHHFLSRAYGNYLGLGEILQFLAAESGFQLGELVCVSSHAELEVSKHGRGRVGALVERCQKALKESK